METSTVGPPAIASSGMNVAVLDEMEQRYAGEEAAHDHDTAHGHAPHPMQDTLRPKNAHMFFNIYFMMTGLHGIHVLLGAGVIIWLIVLSLRGRFNKDYFTPVDLGAPVLARRRSDLDFLVPAVLPDLSTRPARMRDGR